MYAVQMSLLKTPREKEKVHVTSNFSFSHSVFYPFGELCAIFIKFKMVVCKLSVWKSLKFVVWEKVLDQGNQTREDKCIGTILWQEGALTLYLICEVWGLPIQQQIKIIWCQKYGQMGIQLYDWVENIMRNGEIVLYKQFLLFPQYFQKLSIVDYQNEYLWSKGLTLYQKTGFKTCPNWKQ